MPPQTKPLPNGIRFDTLRAQAKDLKSAFAAGDADAAARIEPYFSDLSTSAVRLHHAQLVVAREYGVSSWRKLKGLIEARDAYGKALKTVASIRDRMPRPSQALLDEMKSAQRKLHRVRKLLPGRIPAAGWRDGRHVVALLVLPQVALRGREADRGGRQRGHLQRVRGALQRHPRRRATKRVTRRRADVDDRAPPCAVGNSPNAEGPAQRQGWFATPIGVYRRGTVPGRDGQVDA